MVFCIKLCMIQVSAKLGNACVIECLSLEQKLLLFVKAQFSLLNSITNCCSPIRLQPHPTLLNVGCLYIINISLKHCQLFMLFQKMNSWSLLWYYLLVGAHITKSKIKTSNQGNSFSFKTIIKLHVPKPAVSQVVELPNWR